MSPDEAKIALVALFVAFGLVFIGLFWLLATRGGERYKP